MQLGQAGEDLLRDEVHAAVLRPQVQLPLEPRVRADRESRARAVTCRGRIGGNNVYLLDCGSIHSPDMTLAWRRAAEVERDRCWEGDLASYCDCDYNLTIYITLNNTVQSILMLSSFSAIFLVFGHLELGGAEQEVLALSWLW